MPSLFMHNLKGEHLFPRWHSIVLFNPAMVGLVAFMACTLNSPDAAPSLNVELLVKVIGVEAESHPAIMVRGQCR
jgi:hypothetical protein